MENGYQSHPDNHCTVVVTNADDRLADGVEFPLYLLATSVKISAYHGGSKEIVLVLV